MGAADLKLLLDTHALLWWFGGDARLPARVRAAIDDEEVEIWVSAASAYELTFKQRRGKLPEANALVARFADWIEEEGFRPLPIDVSHATAAGRLPIPHGDPWDRLLIAQALVENLTLVSNEELFDQTGVDRLW